MRSYLAAARIETPSAVTSTSSARLLFSSLARPHYHQIRAADFQARRTAKRNYNSDGRISDGNSKTFVDRDGGSGCVCEAGSSSVEFHHTVLPESSAGRRSLHRCNIRRLRDPKPLVPTDTAGCITCALFHFWRAPRKSSAPWAPAKCW
jgi:hypothetical protein